MTDSGGSDVADAVAETVASLPDSLPFLGAVRARARPSDLAVTLAVVVPLLWVYRLPAGTRRSLGFAPSNPSITTAFAANYVHLTFPHLLSNLGTYVTVALVGYLLAVSDDHRRRFQGALVLALLVFPVLLSYLNGFVTPADLVVGFSGLNMALLGFVAVEFAAFVDEHFTDRFGVENAPAFFFFLAAYVAAGHAASTAGYVLLALSLGLGVVYVATFVLSFRPSLSAFRAAHDRQGYFELLLAAGFVLVAFVPMSFPRNPATDSGTTDLTIHLLGFGLGFAVVYGWVLFGTSADPTGAVPVDT